MDWPPRSGWPVTCLLFLTLGGCVAGFPVAFAEVVEERLPSGYVATAEYLPGDPAKPGVLLIHGFLQTREFMTVRRLADSLSDLGYTTLTPTLTLGMDRRKQSLACESVHTHSMEEDTAELAFWVEWLDARVDGPLVLAGHSAGALQCAAYLEEHPSGALSRVVLISLAYFGNSSEASMETPEDGRRAALALEKGKHDLDRYALAFCREYVTTPEGYISYFTWGKDRTTGALVGSKVPVTIVIGSEDERIDREWLDGLSARGVELISIQGANHFFDREHEFDLLDAFESLLN